jgi:hypothetical protein
VLQCRRVPAPIVRGAPCSCSSLQCRVMLFPFQSLSLLQHSRSISLSGEREFRRGCRLHFRFSRRACHGSAWGRRGLSRSTGSERILALNDAWRHAGAARCGSEHSYAVNAGATMHKFDRTRYIRMLARRPRSSGHFLEYQVAHLAPVLEASAKIATIHGRSAVICGIPLRTTMASQQSGIRSRTMEFYKALGALPAGASVSVASVIMRGNVS